MKKRKRWKLDKKEPQSLPCSASAISWQDNPLRVGDKNTVHENKDTNYLKDDKDE